MTELKCSNCGGDIGTTGLLSPTLEKKRRHQCMKCGTAWMNQLLLERQPPFYGCGHERDTIIMDCNALSFCAYEEWRESTGFDGDKSQCWKCFCKPDNKKTMDNVYGDGSDHEVCSKCGFCKHCKDCECK